MQSQTIEMLDALENAEWFSRVGTPNAPVAVVLSSWAEAISHCSALEWENLCLEAANQHRQRLREKSPERLREWNSIVRAVKPTVESLVRDKIDAVVRGHGLPKVFEDTVRWDMMHTCMEQEFAEVCPPGFYATQAAWYLAGHFPMNPPSESRYSASVQRALIASLVIFVLSVLTVRPSKPTQPAPAHPRSSSRSARD